MKFHRLCPVWLSFQFFFVVGTWSLLLLRAPGFFFFLIWHGDVSAEEWLLEECDGLGIFRFWAGRSVDPGSETVGQWLHKQHKGQTTQRVTAGNEEIPIQVCQLIYETASLPRERVEISIPSDIIWGFPVSSSTLA